MRRILSVFLILSVLFSFSSCADKALEENESIKIMTTIFPYYSFAKAISVGTETDVKMIIEPGAEVHTYSPDAEDVYDYINSDIFIYTGGKSDEWTEALISQSTDVSCVKLIENIDAIEINTHSEHNHSIDEHIWTSPKNAKILVQTICDKICEVDKTNENIYRKNTEKYIESLNEIDKLLSQVSGNTLIFEGVFPFEYLARDYNFDHYSGLSGCDGTSDISVQDLDMLVNHINNSNADTIFYTEFSDMTIADKLCSITNVNKKLLHSCHNVTLDEFNKGETYLSLMKNNADTLLETFNAK